jgi:uncharacterized membrane protein
MKVHTETTSPGPSATHAAKATETTALIGAVLQGGVILSSLVIILGVALLLLTPASRNAAITVPDSLGQVWNGICTLQPAAIIALGLILLIATPVLRVAVSILAFAHEHDRRYVLISSIVLFILLCSFLLGKGGA